MTKFSYYALSTTSPVAAEAMAPRHTHDCLACVYLGRTDNAGCMPEREYGDVYWHADNGNGEAEVIIRHSSDGPDYLSMPASLLDRMPGDAWRAAAVLVALWLEQGQPTGWRGVTVSVRNTPQPQSAYEYRDQVRGDRAA